MRWRQWRNEYLDISEDGNGAAELAVYLTYLAYSSGGMSMVKSAVSALNFYAGLQGMGESNYVSDPLILMVVKVRGANGA